MNEGELKYGLDFIVILVLDDSRELRDSEGLSKEAVTEEYGVEVSFLVVFVADDISLNLTINWVKEGDKHVFSLLFKVLHFADFSCEVFDGVVNSSILQMGLRHVSYVPCVPCQILTVIHCFTQQLVVVLFRWHRQ